MQLTVAPFDDEIQLERLRRRTSQKWRRYPSHILPLFVAESDFPTPPNVAKALYEAIDEGDLGYAEPGNVGEAFGSFSKERFGYEPNPHDVIAVPEVMVGAAEIFRIITEPGDRIVINPPVYPPFFMTIGEVRRDIEEVPLRKADATYELDFDALENAFKNGARAYLFCNPHNPVGRSWSRDDVVRVAKLAERYGVAVIADEIHAPLMLPGATHTPFESVVQQTGVNAITMTSASKGWNIAGLKCALAIASSKWGREVFAKLPEELPERVGHLGVIATRQAFANDVPYLDRVVAHLDLQRANLQSLLEEYGLQKIRYAPPQAGYLAWLDCTGLGLDQEPATVFFKRGKVALYPGRRFGKEGAAHVRFNFATSSAVVEEAVKRMSDAVKGH
ncbi:MAG: aminotransferase class I/II-fold pyridoxal phosphate-dependent enzyme [Candidatus Eremiobacteraeota bacterium]|nr:aminotransferase class I/II-fold pyridoxal phosphate-dependent enzyme [Candidatus Eremiobacteraeota bacterium]